MAEFYGIDVSRYQGQINWQKVKAAGKQFVFVKLGWAGWEGPISIDANALVNIQGAIAAGLHVGIYVYSYCKTPQAAIIAAQETLKLIEPYKLEYPVAFDIESISQTEPNGALYDKMPRATNTAIAAAFLDEIEKAGYYGMLYTYKSFAENYLDMAVLKKYDVWIAQYASKCTYAGNYGIWQNYGDPVKDKAGNIIHPAGSCPGVAGACDLNTAYKDYATIIKSAGLNGLTAPAPDVSELDRLREEFGKLQQENIDLNAVISKLESKLRQINQLSA